MKAESPVLQRYVAFCPSCSKPLEFETPYRDDHLESVTGSCQCGKRWSFIFDLDESGTFGVMSFQCDNRDRIQEKKGQ
jgi:hypothetical protein